MKCRMFSDPLLWYYMIRAVNVFESKTVHCNENNINYIVAICEIFKSAQILDFHRNQKCCNRSFHYWCFLISTRCERTGNKKSQALVGHTRESQAKSKKRAKVKVKVKGSQGLVRVKLGILLRRKLSSCHFWRGGATPLWYK